MQLSATGRYVSVAFSSCNGLLAVIYLIAHKSFEYLGSLSLPFADNSAIFLIVKASFSPRFLFLN